MTTTFDATAMGAEVRSLSSGTIAACMMDSALTEPYRCRDCWTIDQYQGRFARWVECCGREFGSWQQAWEAWCERIYQITGCWRSGYAGSTTYEIPARLQGDGDCTGFEIRSQCMGEGFPWNKSLYDYWKLGVQPRVGTIEHRSATLWVPDEIVCLFPGYVPVRLNPEYENLPPEQYVEYRDDWGLPETVADPHHRNGIKARCRWDWDAYQRDSLERPEVYERYVEKLKKRWGR